jgi:hypothetical protein
MRRFVQEAAEQFKDFVVLSEGGKTEKVLVYLGDSDKALNFVNSPRAFEAETNGFTSSAFVNIEFSSYGTQFDMTFDGCLWAKTREQLDQLAEQVMNQFKGYSTGLRTWTLISMNVVSLATNYFTLFFTLQRTLSESDAKNPFSQ